MITAFLDRFAHRYLTTHPDVENPEDFYMWQRMARERYPHLRHGLFFELSLPFWQSRIYARCLDLWRVFFP